MLFTQAVHRREPTEQTAEKDATDKGQRASPGVQHHPVPVCEAPSRRARREHPGDAPGQALETRRAAHATPRDRALQPGIRARFVRCRHGRGYARPAQPRHRGQGHHRTAEPGAPWCRGSRAEQRRRRRNHAADSRQVLPCCPGRTGKLRATCRGQLRVRYRLPAAGVQGRRHSVRGRREDRRGRGFDGPGLA